MDGNPRISEFLKMTRGGTDLVRVIHRTRNYNMLRQTSVTKALLTLQK